MSSTRSGVRRRPSGYASVLLDDQHLVAGPAQGVGDMQPDVARTRNRYPHGRETYLSRPVKRPGARRTRVPD
jgi:hypothetical protein